MQKHLAFGTRGRALLFLPKKLGSDTLEMQKVI
jgi:hypothetical protein